MVLSLSLRGVQAQGSIGQELAGRLGCFACHSLRGQGGDLGEPLDSIGTRLSLQQLQTALALPRRLHPQAQMPSYAYLPPEEQQALLNYLAGLK
jgi:cbb3-type cytochrome oxidase cytochrome c subunit